VTGAAAKKKAVPTKKEKEKESIRPAGPGALAAGGGLASVDVVNKEEDQEEEGTVHLAATGLDNMLEALELVNAKTDKSSLGAKVGGAVTKLRHGRVMLKFQLTIYLLDRLD
jgi:hypothetical protein